MSGQTGKEATKEGGRMVEGMGGRVKRERGRQGRMEGRKERGREGGRGGTASQGTTFT